MLEGVERGGRGLGMADQSPRGPPGVMVARSVPLRPEGVATCHPLDERTRRSGVPGGTPLAWWSDDRFGWLGILG